MIDLRRTNGVNSKVITVWFKRLALLVVYSIKLANRYNMDEAGIMEGIGTNGLVVGRSGKKVI